MILCVKVKARVIRFTISIFLFKVPINNHPYLFNTSTIRRVMASVQKCCLAHVRYCYKHLIHHYHKCYKTSLFVVEIVPETGETERAREWHTQNAPLWPRCHFYDAAPGGDTCPRNLEVKPVLTPTRHVSQCRNFLWTRFLFTCLFLCVSRTVFTVDGSLWIRMPKVVCVHRPIVYIDVHFWKRARVTPDVKKWINSYIH